ncbi:DUF397 domain-containing protein [Streptomyces tricolor]|nr:DUF397 domain-containing protein [Streptomyces tricolor]
MADIRELGPRASPEVAGPTVLVAVRDSEQPDSAHLAVDPRAWAAFVRSLQVRRPRRAGVRRQEESRGGDHRGRDDPSGRWGVRKVRMYVRARRPRNTTTAR